MTKYGWSALQAVWQRDGEGEVDLAAPLGFSAETNRVQWWMWEEKPPILMLHKSGQPLCGFVGISGPFSGVPL